jgi:predicted TIM-barrel fold metal-dependent hydrolase
MDVRHEAPLRGLGSAVLPCATADVMILDSHMHVGDFPLFGVSLDRDGLLAQMRQHAISTGLVFHPDNALVRGIIRETEGVYGLVWANPRMPTAVDEARRLLDEPGSKFRGVKLHPLLDGYHPDDPAVHPIVELLIERGLPALIHCGHPIFTLPWSIEELANRYPEARIVLGHMGHGNIIYINGAIDVAARHPNVYLETSGMPMHSKIREAVERLGPDRVLYGSDAPFHHPTVELAKIRVSGLAPELVDRVLGENGRRLFFADSVPEFVAA